MKRILMIKVPTFEYHNSDKEISISERVTFKWTLSLATACLSGFTKRYFRGEYTLNHFDMNSVTCGFSGTPYQVSCLVLEATQSVIQDTDFDILAISNQFLFSEQYVDDVIKMAHDKNPDSIIITGGAFATIFPEESIKKPHVNYSVYGEGEHTFVHILNKIYGIDDPEFSAQWAFDGFGQKLENGEVDITPRGAFLDNLEDLPLPLWDPDILEKHTSNNPNASIPVMASRGCPMGCTFCSTHLSWGAPVRYRPIDSVVNEIMDAYNTYGFKNVDLIDDNISFNMKWFSDFCEQLSMVQPDDLKISFSNFDMRKIDENILLGLKKIGVEQVTIATESGHKEGQQEISKKLNLERVRRIVKLIHSEDFFIHNCFLIGLPNETIEQMHETVDFARECRTESIQIWPVFPYPGTKLYEQANSLGFVEMEVDDYASFGSYRKGGVIESTNWDPEEVIQIAYDANIELNFLNNPCYETERGRTYLKNKSDGVIKGVAGHVVALIVSGYIATTYNNNFEERESKYMQALSLLLEEDCIFSRYMHLDFPVINSFREWVSTECSENFDLVFTEEHTPPKKSSKSPKFPQNGKTIREEKTSRVTNFR